MAAADGRFNHVRQVMRMCAPVRAHWRHLANTSELVLPLAHLSPQPKWHVDWFSRFCTAHGSKSLHFTVGAPFPQNCPFSSGCGPHLTHDSSAHPRPKAKRHLDRFSPFLRGSLLYCDRPTDRPHYFIGNNRRYLHSLHLRMPTRQLGHLTASESSQPSTCGLS